MRSRPQPQLLSAVILTALSLCTGCSDDSGLFPSFVQPTEVSVDPQDFLGEVSCSTNQGAMRSYVVILTEYEDETDTSGFPAGVTLPVPCSMVAGFRDKITVGRLYTAEVEAYDLPPEQLEPIGGPSSGTRHFRDADTGEPLTPRWTTDCGTAADTAIAAATNQRRFVRPCDDLHDAAPSPTAIALPPSAVLGDDPCSVAASLDASEDGGRLPAVTGLACDGDAPVFDAVDGQRYSIYATAIDLMGRQLGAECSAVGATGQTVTPQCGELTSQGNARLSLADLMLGDAAVCPAGMFYDVAADGQLLNSVPLACDVVGHIGPFEAGIYPLEVIVYDGLGAVFGGGAECAADIRPGRTRDAFCLALP